MNREALIQLRHVVLNAPDERWDMATFGHCGTSRCAAGHAAEDPWFRAHCPIPTKVYFTIHSGDWEELPKVFGLSQEDSDNLFGLGEGYDEPSREEVVANIDRLLAGEPAQPYKLEE